MNLKEIISYYVSLHSGKALKLPQQPQTILPLFQFIFETNFRPNKNFEIIKVCYCSSCNYIMFLKIQKKIHHLTDFFFTKLIKSRHFEMYVRPLLRYTFQFKKKTKADKFSLSQMQSKLDVINIYPRLQLTTSPGFQVKGGSDVQFFCTSGPLYVRPLLDLFL